MVIALTLLSPLSVSLYIIFLDISCMDNNPLNITHLYITPLNITPLNINPLNITSPVNIAIKYFRVGEAISSLTCQFVFPIILI